MLQNTCRGVGNKLGREDRQCRLWNQIAICGQLGSNLMEGNLEILVEDMGLSIIPPRSERVGVFIINSHQLLDRDYVWGVNSPDMRGRVEFPGFEENPHVKMHMLAVGNHLCANDLSLLKIYMQMYDIHFSS